MSSTLGRLASHARQTLRGLREAACPALADGAGPGSRMRRAAIGSPTSTWRVAPTTTVPERKSFSVAVDQKPPTQPRPDPEVMQHVESAIGKLDTKPLVSGDLAVIGYLGAYTSGQDSQG